MFSSPLFTPLSIPVARLITPWDAIHTEPKRLARWLDTVRAANIEPLVTFEHARDDHCPELPCVLPTPSEYEAALRDFLEHYPWVRMIVPWNEPNHATQPTVVDPHAAAGFYNVARSVCPACTLVAGDVLDSPGMRGWVDDYRQALVEQPTVWGLHNYYDIVNFRATGTQQFLDLVQGEVWLTEAGGIVYHRTSDGHVVHPYDEARAAAWLDMAFQIADRFRDRIPRIYVYQWWSEPDARFDAGLLRPDGTPRQSYDVVRQRVAAARETADNSPADALARRAKPALSIVPEKIRLRSRNHLEIPLACTSGRPATERCSGKLTIEGPAYRRSRLVNGRPPADILEPISYRIRMSSSSSGRAVFVLPRYVLLRIARRGHLRLRISLGSAGVDGWRRSDRVVGLAIRRGAQRPTG
jgi:hypothetical protein